MILGNATEEHRINCLARYLLANKSREEINRKWLNSSKRNSIFKEKLRAALNQEQNLNKTKRGYKKNAQFSG